MQTGDTEGLPRTVGSHLEMFLKCKDVIEEQGRSSGDHSGLGESDNNFGQG